MNEKNPLLCDTGTGMCALPATHNQPQFMATTTGQKPLQLIYFTDPICSSCWAIEPLLRKLKLEYGKSVTVDYHMGGLLPDWSYNSGGISGPADVAHHWDEVSRIYEMPIDGDVWLEDPLNSSYPPSIAFIAATLQDKDKAVVFLRYMRELVFLRKANITKWPYIALAASQAGLDTQKLAVDYNGNAALLFQSDLAMARSMGVTGFPTFFLTNQSGKAERVSFSRSYANVETAIRNFAPAIQKQTYMKDGHFLFSVFPSLTLKEYAELMEINTAEAEQQLAKLVKEGHLQVFITKNGAIWSVHR